MGHSKAGEGAVEVSHNASKVKKVESRYLTIAKHPINNVTLDIE